MRNTADRPGRKEAIHFLVAKKEMEIRATIVTESHSRVHLHKQASFYWASLKGFTAVSVHERQSVLV